MKVSSSAPGKLMLFGEHAVVYGYPCIVTAVDYRVTATVETAKKDIFDIPKGNDDRFVKNTLIQFRKKFKTTVPVSITTHAPHQSYGLGSSSAVTVALYHALCQHFGESVSHTELFKQCYKVVQNVQGVGSGFDIATAVYGGTLWYTKEKFPEKIYMNQALPLIVAYSGVKADTTTQIQRVASRDEKYVKSVFDEMSSYVNQSRSDLQSDKWKRLGQSMTACHKLVSTLEVSTPKLDMLVESAVSAGAYGAKLSGAGGGDCIIALASLEQKSAVEESLKKAGGTIVHVSQSAEGIRSDPV